MLLSEIPTLKTNHTSLTDCESPTLSTEDIEDLLSEKPKIFQELIGGEEPPSLGENLVGNGP